MIGKPEGPHSLWNKIGIHDSVGSRQRLRLKTCRWPSLQTKSRPIASWFLLGVGMSAHVLSTIPTRTRHQAEISLARVELLDSHRRPLFFFRPQTSIFSLFTISPCSTPADSCPGPRSLTRNMDGVSLNQERGRSTTDLFFRLCGGAP